MPRETEEARLKAVVDTAVDGVILIDDAGTILVFNPACERLFGYDAAEVTGQNVRVLMPTPFREEHDHYLANYRTTGVRRIIGIGRKVSGQRKDGTTFPMDLSVGEAMENGKPIFVGIIHDLTERQQQEQEIRESAARLQAVVETAVDGVILIDDAGTILMFNPACERLFGYAAHEVMGDNVKVLMPSPFHGEHDGYLANYKASGVRKIIGIGREVTGRRGDGTTFPMDLSVGEARQEGRSIFVGIIHDLTDRKRTEEQLVQAQKMEAVGQLSGGIAHDFNNLLTVIIGNAEALSVALRARPDLKQLAAGIGVAGERGAELTQRLLAFGRRQTLMPESIDGNRLIRDMHELMSRTLREDIQLASVLAPELWPVFADPAQLESVLLNLYLNAQDAMRDGGQITVTTANISLDERYRDQHPEVPSGDYVLIAVTDEGHGMPSEVLERAFEPFFTTKEVGKGSGLGLSMVYGFVKQSNGHVSIYSEPALGTTVRLYLPADTTDTDPGLPPSEPDERKEATPAKGSETVLVVEDDAFVRGYAIACLEGLGYNVVSAQNGAEALARLAEGTEIDVLFTDVVMPGGITGRDLAMWVREMKPSLPVLFTSGYALEVLADRGQLLPGAVILNKPYRKAELARRLREVIEESGIS